MATEDNEPKPKGIFKRFRAFIRRFFGVRSYLELGKIQSPILICFDHLYSEYVIVSSRVTDPSVAVLVNGLLEKRKSETLSWGDLYHFQLVLADLLPAEQLRTKIRRLRFDYRSVAGEKEFDEYMASKPPDLQSPPQPTDDHSAAHYETLLRDDLKDLLGRMYLEYAILPAREERLSYLTWIAARLCLLSLIVLLGILGILFFIPLIQEMYDTTGSLFDKFNALGNSAKLSSLTVFVVVVSGAMGGFVSALQRIQSPPSEGDSLYNLSLLFHGSSSVFVAPISGAIFAIVLYLLFASGTLMGAFFPTVFTPTGKFTNGSTPTPTPIPTPTSTPPTQTPTPPLSTPDLSPTPLLTPLPDASRTPTPTPTPSPSPKPTQPKPTPQAVPEQGINVIEFLGRSGPASGKDYALLIIWCFIAGFAERFVPDALDRLISGSKPKS